MDWNDVVHRLADAHTSGSFKVQTFGVPNEIDVALRIMRRENYLIAFFNHEIINLTLRPPCLAAGSFPGVKVYFGRIMEWALHSAVLDHMFDSKVLP